MAAPQIHPRELRVDGYRVPEDAYVLKEIETLLLAIRERTTAKLKPTIVAIDGIPGAGKSFATNTLQQGLERVRGLGVVRHEMDRHLKTAPGTPERRRLHDSDQEFRDLYCDDNGATALLSEMLQAQEGSEVNPGRIYSRENRGHIKGTPIQIPEGKKRIILFEGTGAINIAKGTRNDVIGVFVHVDPNTALKAKLQRDIQRAIEARPQFHERDIELATRLRCVPVMKPNDDLIYFDNDANLRAMVNTTPLLQKSPKDMLEGHRPWAITS